MSTSRGAVIWMTGLSGAGKSTLANGLLERLKQAGHAAIVLDVSDPYGFGAGRFLLEAGVDGVGRVQRLDGGGPVGAASAALSIADLSSIVLGGVSPVELARAGRIVEGTPGAALALARAFATDRAPSRLNTKPDFTCDGTG